MKQDVFEYLNGVVWWADYRDYISLLIKGLGYPVRIPSVDSYYHFVTLETWRACLPRLTELLALRGVELRVSVRRDYHPIL